MLKDTKCHDWNSNPPFAVQKHQSLSPMLLTAQPQHPPRKLGSNRLYLLPILSKPGCIVNGIPICRPDTSQSQPRRLPPCLRPHEVPFSKEKMPWCPCPFKNEAYGPESESQELWIQLGSLSYSHVHTGFKQSRPRTTLLLKWCMLNLTSQFFQE